VQGRRALTVLVALLPLVAIGVSSAGPALAQGAHAKQPVEVVVHANLPKLVSSTGRTLYLGIEAENDAFHNQPPGADSICPSGPTPVKSMTGTGSMSRPET
jgi:hypothetical protein